MQICGVHADCDVAKFLPSDGAGGLYCSAGVLISAIGDVAACVTSRVSAGDVVACGSPLCGVVSAGDTRPHGEGLPKSPRCRAPWLHPPPTRRCAPRWPRILLPTTRANTPRGLSHILSGRLQQTKGAPCVEPTETSFRKGRNGRFTQRKSNASTTLPARFSPIGIMTAPWRPPLIVRALAMVNDAPTSLS